MLPSHLSRTLMEFTDFQDTIPSESDVYVDAFMARVPALSQSLDG